MKCTRILSVLLACLLALLPMAALAEVSLSQPGEGAFTLRISDPVIEYTDATGTERVDLTGVGLQLGGVSNPNEAQGIQVLLSLMLLANGDPALSAMAGATNDQFFAFANGISHLLVISYEDMVALMQSSAGFSPVLATAQNTSAGVFVSYEKLTDMQSLFTFTEGPEEPVEFYSESGVCPRYSLTLTRDEIADLLGESDVDLPADMSAELCYFKDDRGNLRAQGVLKNALHRGSDVGSRDIEYLFLLEQPVPRGVFKAGGHIIANNETAAYDFAGQPDARYPEHFAVEGTIDLPKGTTSPQILMSLTPNEAEDGMVADAFNMTVLEDKVEIATLDMIVGRTESQESYFLVMESDDSELSVGYDGSIETVDGDSVHTGVLSSNVHDPSVNGSFTCNIRLTLSGSAQGKLPDISGMPQIDMAQITDEQLQQLSAEATQLGVQVMGKLMTLPSVAELLSAAMQSGALPF